MATIIDEAVENLNYEKLELQKTKNRILYDGWVNLLTGLGTNRDKTGYTDFKGIELIPDATLAEIWVGDGFGKSIIETVADDMTREWISIVNDNENRIYDELERLNAEYNFNLAVKWARLFGGAIIVMGIDDGEEITSPVKIEKVKKIQYLKVFSRPEIMIYSQNYDTDLLSPNYGELNSLYIVPRFGTPFTIHTDRCLIFKGIPVPTIVQGMNFFYWGMSAIQPIWTDLRNFGAATNMSIKLLYEFLIGKYSMKDLVTMLATPDGEKKIRDRINIIELSKSTINAVLLDSEESYTRDAASIAGLSDLLDRFMMFLAGVAKIPVTKLFGRSAAGLNSTGEGDLTNYYDNIKSQQKVKVKPNLLRLCHIVNQTLGNIVNKPGIEFNSLTQLSDLEKADLKLKTAQTDKIYCVDIGAISTEEITKTRFVNGWSDEINIQEQDLLTSNFVKGNQEEKTTEEPEAPIVPDKNLALNPPKSPLSGNAPSSSVMNQPFDPGESKVVLKKSGTPDEPVQTTKGKEPISQVPNVEEYTIEPQKKNRVKK